MLRIAVDARPLSQPNTGIGRYLAEVLPRLIAMSPHHWYLYCDQHLEFAENWSNATLRCSHTKSAWKSHLQAQFQFSSWALKDRCDLYWSPRHQLPLRLAGRIPLVVTLHDLVFKTHPHTMTFAGRCLERLLTAVSLRKATSIVTTTNYVRKEIERWYPDQREKIQVIPLSSSLGEIDRSNNPLEELDLPYVVFCGTMEPRKNLDRLIGAFTALKHAPDPPPHHLVLVSSTGWRNQSTLNLISRHSEFIKIVGGLSEADKATAIAHSDFLALPSLAEGFGIPLIEAMKLGVPILTGAASAMPEVAGDAALYVDPLDEADITRGLSEMARNDALRAQLAARALARSNEFDWQKTAEQTLATLVQAADND